MQPPRIYVFIPPLGINVTVIVLIVVCGQKGQVHTITPHMYRTFRYIVLRNII